MTILLMPHQTLSDAVQAIGFAPIAGVQPVLHVRVDRSAAGWTPNPPRCEGGEFNQLAPQTPERLSKPRSRVIRQRWSGRSPPSLKALMLHGSHRVYCLKYEGIVQSEE